MSDLPIYAVLPELKAALAANPNVVLQAPPGAGKTTAVPLALLDADWLRGRNIIMLEPRRLAARSAARRMAQLLGESVGQTVGYQVRGERRHGQQTRILVVTEGVLTRMLQSDPELEGTALVIFDEFHERNLQADLSLALCLQSQEVLREDLKLLVMSATLDTEGVSGLLGGAESGPVPVVISEGRSFPVEVDYLPPRQQPQDVREIPALMARKIIELLDEKAGSLLAFLPGVAEIRQLEKLLKERLATRDNAVLLAPLYGDLDRQQQDAAIAPAPDGQRKIVMATNVAETSLTIDGISLVVDSGLMRESRFDPNSGMSRLLTTPISRASATQRSGRSGRLGPGYALRLWTESRQQSLPSKNTAEILLGDLTPLVLELAQWGIADPTELRWLNVPPPGPFEQGRALLAALGALDADGRITSHGALMLSLGLHPRLAHMLIRSQDWGLQSEASLLAALLSERDIFRGEQRWDRDIQKRMDVLQGTTRIDQADRGAIQRIRQQARSWMQQLRQHAEAEQPIASGPHSSDAVGVLLALAYPDRIAQNRRDRDRRFLLSGGRGAHFSHEDPLAHEEFLVVAELDGEGRDARIQLAARIPRQALEAGFAGPVTRNTFVRWDQSAARVVARERLMLGGLVLEERPARDVSPEQMSSALLDAIRQSGLDSLPWSREALALRARVNFLGKYLPVYGDLAHLQLPDWSDAGLLESMESWLLPHLQGLSRLEQLRQLDLRGLLLAQLSWDCQQALDQLVPTHLQVPSGSRIAIRYEEDPPVLAVRLQEMFGLVETPAILSGRVPLMLHLLSPAQRPVQVTRDLASFWENTYEEVKKELRIRYQKHYWPDDPRVAQATNKTKKRM